MKGIDSVFLLRKTGGIDGIEASQLFANVLFLLLDMREGVIAPAIVITVVACTRGRFGTFAHLEFPLFGDQLLQFFAAVVQSLKDYLARLQSASAHQRID